MLWTSPGDSRDLAGSHALRIVGFLLALLLAASGPLRTEAQEDAERAARMEQAAVDAMKRLLEKLETASPFDGVSSIEAFMSLHAKSKVVQDEALQRKAIEAAGLPRSSRYGSTLREILAGFRQERALLCMECKAVGTMPCKTCKGTGGKPCSRCGGTGKEECYYCDGKKTESCGKCYGDGTVSEKVPEFGKPGDYTYQDVTCPTCKGKGTVACKKCSGKGKTVCGDRDCTGTGFDISLRCNTCAGAKIIACRACNGTGRTGNAAGGEAPPAPSGTGVAEPPRSGGATGGAVAASGLQSPRSFDEIETCLETIQSDVSRWESLRTLAGSLPAVEYEGRRRGLYRGTMSPEEESELLQRLYALKDAYEAQLLTRDEFLQRAQAQFR